MAEHKRKNKVSSLLSSAANVTFVSALNKFEIKLINWKMKACLKSLNWICVSSNKEEAKLQLCTTDSVRLSFMETKLTF